MINAFNNFRIYLRSLFTGENDYYADMPIIRIITLFLIIMMVVAWALGAFEQSGYEYCNC